MLPLRDDMRTRTFPVVTWAIVAANVAVFVHEWQLGAAVDGFFREWGLVPARFHATVGSRPLEAVLPLLTSLFVHGGFVHIGSNLLYLHVFGDDVEDRFGHARYLGFYLFTGAVAGVTHAALSPGSEVPMVGASGAIAGVTGAFLVNFPRSKVMTAVPVFVFFRVVRIPAAFFLVAWFALQVLAGTAALEEGAETGVAWWAHVGGFVTGVVLGRPLRRRR